MVVLLVVYNVINQITSSNAQVALIYISSIQPMEFVDYVLNSFQVLHVAKIKKVQLNVKMTMMRI